MNLQCALIVCLSLLLGLAYSKDYEILYDLTGQVNLYLTPTSNGINISLGKPDFNLPRMIGEIAKGFNFEDDIHCCNYLSCKLNDLTTLKITPLENAFQISYESSDLSVVFEDCFLLKMNDISWYGGPERYTAKWPIEKLSIKGDEAYVLKKADNFAVAEPYWLNSQGGYFFVDRRTPLFIDQNNKETNSVCLIAKLGGPYINRNRVVLNYTLAAFDNPKTAHLHAVKNFLKKPKKHPNENMIRQPIWTTWAKYKKDISDQTVLEFAQDILDHGFKGGQLEIDDDWEVCYGAQTFKTDKFANITETVRSLKNMNYRVTAWVHPFVDDTCKSNSQEGKDKGYFVKNTTGSDLAAWWDNSNSHQIDFTNKDARDWFTNRLKSLQKNVGIDSFKFDAGETDYSAQPPVFSSSEVELYPNILAEDYVRACAEFGDLIEVRSATNIQDLGVFVRMLDKDSNWGENNGLYTLITTLLQMNMNGYTMVLPDMVGGNGYNGAPSAELLARWTQANTFMPAMQFSYLPWDITSDEFDGLGIITRYVNLHNQYADEILKAMNDSIVNGTPVNPPVWWVDPTHKWAHKIDDEYLLGESILVSPVIKEGADKRDVFLPTGSWKDGNNGTIYKGPSTLKNYSAPIDVLPYFIKQ